MYEDIYASIRNAAQKRNLRESTINLYCNDVRYFLKCTGKDVTDLTIEDVDAFLTAKRLEGRSPETYNHYHSAIRFFYKKILKLNWDDEDIPRMKLNRSLPTVLSREEISAIIDVTKNLKHKAMIATMYSSGLRVSEVIHLHYDDISRTNMTIHVRNTKSRRDRYTILSQKNLDLLTEYWFKCGRPRGILFPSSWTGSYIDNSSVNQFFKANAKKAGVDRLIEFREADATRMSLPTDRGIIVTNPPYGERMMERKGAQKLYRAMGKHWRFADGWGKYILSSEPEFEYYYGARAAKKRKLYNGRLQCNVYMYYPTKK